MSDIKEIILRSQISGPGALGPGSQGSVPKSNPVSREKFESALSDAEIQISKHAQKRLEAREIELSSVEKTQLSDAVNSLEKKGARDSLVLMGEHAFIVNVPSKTVVTAMNKSQMKEQVFTNIDSTILV